MSSSRLQSLQDERDHLLSSLADLERERAAGDIDADAYEGLRATYTARAAAAIREIEATAPHEPSTVKHHRFRRYLGRRGTRRVLLALMAISFVGLGITLVISRSDARTAGEQATGGVVIPKTASVRQDLDQASELGSEGQLQEAITLYNAVLAAVPDQPEALTYEGWLERLAGLASNSKVAISSGDALLAKAARVAPRYPDAHALDGLALLEDHHDAAAAIRQFNVFLGDQPSTSLLRALGPKMASAYRSAKSAVPARLVPYE